MPILISSTSAAKNLPETGADGLSLTVGSLSETVRTESGMGFQIQDSNYDETISIAPMFAIGWAMECPINRPAYHASFAGEPFGFEAKGWDRTFHMLTIDAAIKLQIYDFALTAEYESDTVKQNQDTYWGQRFNLILEYAW